MIPSVWIKSIFQPGWVLQLRPGPTLLGRAVSVFTNHPEDPSDGFTRSRYRRLRWMSDSRNKGDDTALYVEVILSMPGSFHYYFTYEDGLVNFVFLQLRFFFSYILKLIYTRLYIDVLQQAYGVYCMPGIDLPVYLYIYKVLHSVCAWIPLPP